jgi:membrane dipeptidase
MLRMGITLLIAALAGAAVAQPVSKSKIEVEARRIHEATLTLDTHIDIPLDYVTEHVDPGRIGSAQVDLPKMRIGGLKSGFFIVYTPQGPLSPEGFAMARRVAQARLDGIERLLRAYPREAALAASASEVAKIVRDGRVAVLIGMENAYPLGAALGEVGAWHARGVRYVGITHFGHNQFADSSNPNTDGGEPEERYGGLSSLGRALVGELNRAGIMVDVSHASKKTMMQAVELSAAPGIASHSGARAVADDVRNLDDEQLRALGASGGVAQMVALDVYVKPLNEAQRAHRALVRKQMKLETAAARASMSSETREEYAKRLSKLWEIEPRATVSDFVNHIDHAVKIAGIDHVGISSDFDGGGGVVGWMDASETFEVTLELVRRGYTQAEIAKLWGGNLLRVMEDAERTARRLRNR